MTFMNSNADAAMASPAKAHAPWQVELAATTRLAWPLVIAQIAQMMLMTTDVVMMGWLGPQFLAAGMLTISLFSPLLLFGTGIVGAVVPLAAQAIGAGEVADAHRSARQGIWVAIALAVPLVLLASQVGWLFTTLGMKPDLSLLAQSYARFAAWLFLPALLAMAFRSLLLAHGETKIVLAITLFGIVLNAAANYALMFGNWGAPRLELEGAGLSTTLVNLIMLLLAAGYCAARPRYRKFGLFLKMWRADWRRFMEILRLGVPIGLSILAEVGLFFFAAVLMGWLGTNELAAHAVALQLAGLAFMVPLGLSQATTVRVGLKFGSGDKVGVARAGWISLALGGAFMTMAATLFALFPNQLVGLFFVSTGEGVQVTMTLAATYLAIAALFQLADGTQAVSAAALRGLGDTKMPMYIAVTSFWVVGLPLAYALGFWTELRGIGVWLGLAGGLTAAAIALSLRFAFRNQLGLI